MSKQASQRTNPPTLADDKHLEDRGLCRESTTESGRRRSVNKEDSRGKSEAKRKEDGTIPKPKEDGSKPKPKEDGSKVKPKEDSSKPKQKEDGSKQKGNGSIPKQKENGSIPKQKEDSSIPKQKEDSSKLKPKEDSSKLKQKENGSKLKQKEDSSNANQKDAESNVRQEDEVSLKQQDDSSKLKQKEDGSKLKRKEDGSKPKEDHPKLKQKEDSSKANQKHAESNVRQEDEVNVKQRDDSSKLKQDGSKLKQDGSKLKQREDSSNAKQRDDESSVRQRDDSSKATKKSLCHVNQKKIVQNPAAKVSHISKSTDNLRKEKNDRTLPKPLGEKGNGKCRVVSIPRAAIRGEEDKENTSIVLLTDVPVSQTPRHGHPTAVCGSGKKQKTKKDSVQGGKPPVRARKRSADEATKKRYADHGGTIVLEQTATPCNPRASVACESNAGRLVELSCHLKLSVLANVLDTVVCVSIWTPVAVYRRMALPGDIRQLR